MCISEDSFDNRLLSTHSDNVRDEYRNRHYNRFKGMGRLNRYSTFDFVNNGEKLEVKEFKHNMRNVKLKKVIAKCKKEPDKHIELGLPLPITKDCHFLGVLKGSPRRVFSQRRTYEKDSLLEYFITKVDVDYQETEDNNIQTFNGDWMHSSKNLIDMAQVKEKTYATHEMIEAVLNRINIDFKLPLVKFYSPKFILGLDVKPKAFPGLGTSKLIAKFRKDSSRYTKDYAYKYCQYIMKSPRQILDTSLITVGGREKRVKFNSDEKGKKVRTRVTCMMEDVPTLIGQSLSNPITNCIPEIRDHFCQLAKVYGQGNMLRYRDMMQPRHWKDVVCDLDYSGHDNNVNENQIVVAFAFLRLCFPKSKEIDRLFYYCMSSLINKRVVLPGSNMVYRLCRGVSSGHAFTSLITTFCAYINLATALERVTYKMSTNYYEQEKLLLTTYIGNAGDDCNMRLSSELVVPMYEDLLHNSGHNVDDIRNNGYINSNNVKSRVTFLKKQFHDFSWNSRELFTNLVHPTTAEKNFGHRADNLKVLMYQSPLNTELNNKIICLILCYILGGRGYRHKDMIRAQLEGRTLKNRWLIDYCLQLGWNNPHFIDKLLELNYGFINVCLHSVDKDTILGTHSMFGRTIISLDAFIKDQLRGMKQTLIKKKNWFTFSVNYKMHRSKNTLTVYDFMKTYTKPKSSNISYDALRLYYNKMYVR